MELKLTEKLVFITKRMLAIMPSLSNYILLLAEGASAEGSMPNLSQHLLWHRLTGQQ